MSDHSVRDIGARLKSRRLKRDLTLQDLSELTGISPSTISRLESGKRAPNLELVVPIARALRLELDDLVPRSVPDPRVPRVTKRVDQVTFEQLSPTASPSQAARVTFPAPEVGAQSEPRVHDGYEWFYVLSGRLRLVLGEHDLIMGPGEAAEFDTAPRTCCVRPALGPPRSSRSSARRASVSTCGRGRAPLGRESNIPSWCRAHEHPPP